MNTEDKMIAVMERINQMPGDIRDCAQNTSETYFTFHGHTFSITNRAGEGGYSFYVYPKWRSSTEKLARAFEEDAGTDIPFVAFKSEESAGRAKVFAQLFKTVQARALSIDDILDDILNNAIPF